ncbi:MAG: hypothetical protein AB8B63_15345 [Granulosicoccus sp.]
MNRNYKQRALIACVTVFFTVWLSACDFLLDKALDCLDNDRPDLRPNALRNPVLNQTYDELVQVSIRNEPRDDTYNYQFFFIGASHDGMQYRSSGREFRLSGTPIELGEFRFSIQVKVSGIPDSFNDTSGLCSTEDTNNYIWAVQIM